MKVLNVSMAIEPVVGGGTAERTYHLSRFLTRAGADCAILTLDWGLTPQLLDELHPAKVTALPCHWRRYGIFALPERRIAELVRWADVIHLVGHWTLLNAAVWEAAVRIGRPYVVCPAGALRIYGRSRLLKLAYNGILGKRMVHDASACIAVSPNELAHFSEIGVPASRVTQIPNGVDVEVFRDSDPGGFRRKFGLPAAPFVLFFGRLNSIKGPDLLLGAYSGIARSFPDLQLVVAGRDEGLLQPLREMARRAGIAGRVHFIGPVSGVDRSHAYHAASLLVVPSRQEAMSIVALEAGICGTPVLVTDRCGFDEVAESGGGLVSPATTEGLQAGLRSMLASMDKLREMGENLRAYINAHYLWNTIARRYLDVFDGVVAARKAACGS